MLTQVCTALRLVSLFQGLKKKKIAGHRTLSTLRPILVPAFQNLLHTMITQAKAEEDCLTLQSLSIPNMSFVRKIPKNFGKSSIVTFVIQVGASIKQVSLTITCRLLPTEAINILVVSVWNLNLTLYLWWSSVILRAIFNLLLQGMRDKSLKIFMLLLEIQIRCQRWSLMKGWIGINAIHSDLCLTKRRRTPALEMTH